MTDDEHSERWQTTETAELLDERTTLIEDEAYEARESLSIKFLKEHNVPLLYQSSLFRKVQYDPERYAGMLRPFYEHPPLDYDAPMNCFFERQLVRWQEFIRFQMHNRGSNSMTKDLLDQGYRAMLVREATSGSEWWALMSDWTLGDSQGRYEEYVNRRKDERTFLRDRDCHNFGEYQAAVRERLARNGVDLSTGCVLNEELGEQDPLTTWTEYLAFEYWHMEQYDEDINIHRPMHDRAYQRLQGAVALRAYETSDFLPTEEAQVQRRVELDQAYRWCDEAALTIARLEQRPASMQRNPADMHAATHFCRTTRMMAEAQAELEAATAAKDAAARRDEKIAAFLHETDTYREVCDIRERHSHLLAWARDEYEKRRVQSLTSPPQEGGPSSLSQAGASPLQSHVSFQLPPKLPVERAAMGWEASDTERETQGEGFAIVEPQPAAAEAGLEEHQAGVGESCDAPPSSVVVQSPPVETAAVEQPAKEPPTTTQSPDVQSLPASASHDARTTDVAAAATTSSRPRRSARIAAMREKADKLAALQSVETNLRSENLSRGGRRHGRSKAVVERETQDAEPPAKRTRRRTARK